MATSTFAKLLGTSNDHVASLHTIVTNEPIMQHGISLLNTLSIGDGVRMSINFQKPNKEFERFFAEHFVAKLPLVLRYKLYCGFIPWFMHQDKHTGNIIPMIVPIGCFSWHVQVKSALSEEQIVPERASKKFKSHAEGAAAGSDTTKDHSGEKGGAAAAGADQQSPKASSKKQGAARGVNAGPKRGGWNLFGNTNMRGGGAAASEGVENRNLEKGPVCEYVVQVSADIGVPTENVFVINLVQPDMAMRNHSMGQAQFSPLYVVLQHYLTMQLAMQRRVHADEWNTTARLFTKNNPPTLMNERAGREEIPYGSTRFAQAQMPDGFFTYEHQKLRYHNNNEMLRDELEQKRPHEDHVPAVYTLPQHHDLANGPSLAPLLDIEYLETQYRLSIAHCLHIPYDLIERENAGSRMNTDTLPFNSEMVKNTCAELVQLMEKVLQHMYCAIYHLEASEKNGVNRGYVRFNFNMAELYSEAMKEREDEVTELEKKPPPAPSAASKKK